MSLWIETRKWRDLLPAVPALLLLAMIVVPLLAVPMSSEQVVQRYKVAVNRAIGNQEYEMANLYLEKLFTLGERDDEEVRYNAAILASLAGESEKTRATMRSMAPVNELGYGPAHLWLTRDLLKDPKWFETRETVDAVVAHIESALKFNSDDKKTIRLAAQVYAQTKRYAKALENYEQLVDQDPSIHLALAELNEAMGNSTAARREFGHARVHYMGLLANKPEDPMLRIKLALIHNRLRDFSSAETVLLGKDPKEMHPEVRQALVALYVTEADRLRINNPSDEELANSLKLLQNALRLNPAHQLALSRLVAYTEAEGQTGETARSQLESVLAQGVAAPTVHLILASRAINEKDFESAKHHLTQAYRQDKNMPVTLNNIAWLIVQQGDKGLDRALEMVNRGLDLLEEGSPMRPLMIDTRGLIFLKKKQWEKAIADFEAALPALNSTPEIHDSLAEAYENVGQDSLAEKHRMLSEHIKKKMSTPKR